MIKRQGRHCLLLIEKKERTTAAVAEELARKLGIARGRVGFAGTKDKYAVTRQWFSIADMNDIPDIELTNAKILKKKQSSRLLHLGSLVGNRFVITFHNCKNTGRFPDILKQIKVMPNYFGSQRFGEKNAEIGLAIVRKQYKKACSLILNSKHSRGLYEKRISKHLAKRPRDYEGALRQAKQQTRLFVHSLQSWIFNESLSVWLKKYDMKNIRKALPLVGYKTKLGSSEEHKIVKSVMKKLGLKPSDFGACVQPESGSERAMFIKISGINYSFDNPVNGLGKIVKLEFELPKGSYASVLLQEICRKPFNKIWVAEAGLNSE